MLDLFPWAQLPSRAGDLIAVMFVTAISTLLKITGIEYATHREANLDRELIALGVADLCSAVAGGYVSCISLSRTILTLPSELKRQPCSMPSTSTDMSASSRETRHSVKPC